MGKKLNLLRKDRRAWSTTVMWITGVFFLSATWRWMECHGGLTHELSLQRKREPALSDQRGGKGGSQPRPSVDPQPLLQPRALNRDLICPSLPLLLHNLCPGVQSSSGSSKALVIPAHATQPVHWKENWSTHSGSNRNALHAVAWGDSGLVASALPFLRMSLSGNRWPREVPPHPWATPTKWLPASVGNEGEH